MKNKQIAGIVVAAVAFIAVYASSMLTTQLSNQIAAENAADMMSMFSSETTAVTLPEEPFIGVVRVEGTIMDSGSSTMFETVVYDHQGTLDYIDEMIASDYNEGLLLFVDSPGGTVTESDELYLKLMEYKEVTGRKIWTYMGDQACSGGYYISMASDHIGINRNGWTGSIGVIISLVNYTGLYEKLGIEEVNITSGVNKAMGSSGEVMTEEQEAIFQSLVDESYEQFVGIIAEGRNMSVSDVKELADGRIYTAKQALSNGLVDEVVNTYDDFESKFQKELGEGVIIYEPDFSGDDVFASLFAKVGGGQTKSDAQVLSEYLESKESGVLMYYAGYEH